MTRPADYYPDPDTPGLARWWDGERWTDRVYTPVLVPGIENIRRDIRTIRNVVAAWAVFTVLGVLLIWLGI